MQQVSPWLRKPMAEYGVPQFGELVSRSLSAFEALERHGSAVTEAQAKIEACLHPKDCSAARLGNLE